jgi:hypothetical protein
MNRRNLLAGLAGIFAGGLAPAAIGSGVLMPVRRTLVYGLPGYPAPPWTPMSANLWYYSDGSGFQGGEVNRS